MPQQTSTFESHFLTHMQGVAGAYHKLIVYSWVPILQVGGLSQLLSQLQLQHGLVGNRTRDHQIPSPTR